ncbi:hypothetical protein Tco_0182460, partial [Tanacetum coccineum]
MPPEDDVFIAEEQPSHDAASPTAKSPGYIPESDPEKNLEEDPADYPADREDDDDDDEDEDEDRKRRRSTQLWPTLSHIYTGRGQRLLAFTTLPPSPLTPLSSPLPQIPSPPLPIPSPPPDSPTHIEIPQSCLPLWNRLRFAAPTSNYEVGESLAVDAARQDGPAVARKDPYSVARGDLYGFFDRLDVAPGRPISRELDYGITDTWDDLVGAIEEIAPTTLEGVNQRVTNLSTTVEQETTIMY